MYLHKLRIHDLRGIGDAELELEHPRAGARARLPNVNLLVGDNGTGKTTVLRAAAMALLSPILAQAGFAPQYLVRHGKQEAIIEAELALSARQDQVDPKLEKGAPLRMAVRIERVVDDERIVEPDDLPIQFFRGYYTDASPAYFVAGYGAMRRAEAVETYRPDPTLRPKRQRFRRVEGLFHDDAPLTPLTSWLPAARRDAPKRFEEVVALINAVLPEGARLDPRLDRDEIRLRQGDFDVPWPAISDGFRAFVGWFADLTYQLLGVCPDGWRLAEIEGVVLVDEIDLYLHPRWQRVVIDLVAKALPRIQFIFSTHSPIVTGSVEPENIHLLEATARGEVTARRLHESTYGLTADQVLGSAYFGVVTSRAPGAVSELAELSRKAGEGDEEAALAYLKRLGGASPAAAPRPRPARKASRSRRSAG